MVMIAVSGNEKTVGAGKQQTLAFKALKLACQVEKFLRWRKHCACNVNKYRDVKKDIWFHLNSFSNSNYICDTLRDLVPFVQLKKREKHL